MVRIPHAIVLTNWATKIDTIINEEIHTEEADNGEKDDDDDDDNDEEDESLAMIFGK